MKWFCLVLCVMFLSIGYSEGEKAKSKKCGCEDDWEKGFAECEALNPPSEMPEINTL